MPKILVVEDYDDSRISLCQLLNLSGYTVLEAKDGQEGIDRAYTDRPDLILMDLSLPVVDGITATRTLRASDDLEGTPIVALSAYDTETHRNEALGAGCVAYVLKPVDFDELDALIKKILS